MTGKLKVLVVDDEKDVRDALTDALQAFAFDVISCMSGPGTLRKLEELTPDVILLDYAMPLMDGIETLRKIKQRKPFVPVIMLTAHDYSEVGFEAGKAGADEFLPKPPEIGELVAMIKTAVKYSRPANVG